MHEKLWNEIERDLRREPRMEDGAVADVMSRVRRPDAPPGSPVPEPETPPPPEPHPRRAGS